MLILLEKHIFLILSFLCFRIVEVGRNCINLYCLYSTYARNGQEYYSEDIEDLLINKKDCIF